MHRVGMNTPELDTPALVIDLDRAEANMRRAAAIADRIGIKMRPHAKTHKSPYFALQQVALGAIGVSVAKISEAIVMADGGITDIFVANTIFGARKLQRVADLAGRVRLAVGIDDIRQAHALSDAMSSVVSTVDVLVEVDTGARRGGIAPAEAWRLAEAAHRLPGIAVKGVYTYEGYTYTAESLEDLQATLREAHSTLLHVADDIGRALDIQPVVSVGSTPGLLGGAEFLPGLTEFRAGTYVFLDAAQARIAGGIEHCAASVLASVVSRPSPDRAILDAGSKTLSSDRRSGGLCHVDGFGLLPDIGVGISRLSEEHAVIEGAGAGHLELGQKVRVIPNHICAVVNLFPEMIGVRDDVVERVIPVQARDCLQ